MRNKIWLLALALPLCATLNEGIATNVDNTQDTKESQARINALNDKEQEAFMNYREALREIETLKSYNAQLRQLIISQEEEMKSLNEQIVEIEVTQQRILPLMKEMVESFQTFVKVDTPFLIDERKKRADSLEGLLNKANLTISQKFRSIIEAFNIELEFGRTIEAFDAPLDRLESVRFLRIGRTALYYLTKDEKTAGVYDGHEKKFVEIDSSYIKEIKKGIKIANKQLAPQLLYLPVIRSKEAI